MNNTKGHSTSIVEDEIIHLFKQQFMETTLPVKEQESLESLGIRRAARSGNTEEDEIKQRALEAAIKALENQPKWQQALNNACNDIDGLVSEMHCEPK